MTGEFTRQLDEVAQTMLELSARLAAKCGGSPCVAFRQGRLSAREHAQIHAVSDRAVLLRETAVLIDLTRTPEGNLPVTSDFVRKLHERAREAYAEGMELLEVLAGREWTVAASETGREGRCPREPLN